MYQLPDTRLHDRTPQHHRGALALASVLAGAAILLGTFSFYGRVVDTTMFDVLNWVQPVLLVFSGVSCIAAAAVSLVRPAAGRATLSFALGVLPVILVWRLVLVGIRFVMHAFDWFGDTTGRTMDGTIKIDLRPGWSTTINIVVVLVIVVCVIWADGRRGERSGKDE